MDIILNLKDLKFTLERDEPVELEINKSGPGEVIAADIDLKADVEVVDEDAHIATVSEGGTLEMRLTVKDPTTWEKPWTVLLPMRPTEGELIECACHEGNLSMVNLLEVARDAEKAAAAKAKAPATQPAR